MSSGQQAATVEQSNALTEWLMQRGHGKDIMALDRRGLEFLLEKHLPTLGLRILPDDEQIGGGRIYLGLAF